MKLKNISVFERHAEKFVILATLLILIAVVYFYGLNTPNLVAVGGTEVPPGEVDKVISVEAQNVQRRLSSGELAPELGTLTIADYTDVFVRNMTQPTLSPDTPTIAMGPVSNLDSSATAGTGEPYYQPTILAPEIVAAASGMGTITPEDVAAAPQLNARFASDKPANMVWVSVAAQFDLGQQVAEFSKEPAKGMRRLPEDWWHNPFAIGDVQLQRQEMRADGSWPAEGDPDYDQLTTLVAPAPDATVFRDLPDDMLPEQLYQLQQIMHQYQVLVINPTFYNLKGFRQWEPPVKLMEGELSPAEKLLDLRNKIKANDRTIEMMRKQILNLQTAGQRAATRGMSSGFEESEMVEEDYSEDPEGGSGRATPVRPTRPVVPRVDAKQKRIENYNKLITEKTTENQTLIAEYQAIAGRVPGGRIPVASMMALGDEEYGMDAYEEEMMMMEEEQMMYDQEMMGPGAYPGGYPGATLPGVPRVRRSPTINQGPMGVRPQERVSGRDIVSILRGKQNQPLQPVEEVKPKVIQNLGVLLLDPEYENKVDVWANDFTAEPGKVYRYRMRLGVVNPFWNKTRVPEVQKPMTKDFIVYGEYSDWTGNIEVERLQHFFVMGGGKGLSQGQGRVNFGVWKFDDGQWWQGEFPAQAGDPIGGTKKVTILNELNQQEEIELDFSTGAYLVDMDFDFQVPGAKGNIGAKTLRVLYSRDGRVQTRRADQDRTDPKQKWLEAQKELLATASIVQ